MNYTLADTIVKGMNNPECAFWVGQSLGGMALGSVIFRVALVYFGFKLLDKVVFKLIPDFWRRIKTKRYLEENKREWQYKKPRRR